MMTDTTVDVVSRYSGKDSIGNPTIDYTLLKTIRTSKIIPFGDESARLSYGFITKTTHRVFTRDPFVQKNQFIRYQNQFYHIKEIADFGKFKALLLELLQK